MYFFTHIWYPPPPPTNDLPSWLDLTTEGQTVNTKYEMTFLTSKNSYYKEENRNQNQSFGKWQGLSVDALYHTLTPTDRHTWLVLYPRLLMREGTRRNASTWIQMSLLSRLVVLEDILMERQTLVNSDSTYRKLPIKGVVSPDTAWVRLYLKSSAQELSIGNWQSQIGWIFK